MTSVIVTVYQVWVESFAFASLVIEDEEGSMKVVRGHACRYYIIGS